MVTRHWTNDSSLVRKAFERMRRHQHPTWLVLYPEGTRRTAKKLVESQAYARHMGRAELQRVLWPRTKGFVATIQGESSFF